MSYPYERLRKTGLQCSYYHDRPLAALGTGGGMDATQSATL